jgi:hypothetical protein
MGSGTMSGLRGEKLLQAWELSRELPEQEAVLALLELAWPDRPSNEWARMPLGERNALLLELRAATLGRRMETIAKCPACGALLECTLDALVLAEHLREQAAEAKSAAGNLRPVTTEDLLAAATADDDQGAQRILLARTADRRGAEESGGAAVAVLEEFESVNGTAEIRLELECPDCPARPVMDLDVAQFLLREIAGAARRLMAEIHELARAYGWSERTIAAMTPARRGAYLEMLGV